MKLYFYYYGKTAFGLIAIAVFLYMYILNPENLNFESDSHWIGVDVFWVVLLIDLSWRFIPGKFHHIGQQKYLKRCFLPSDTYKSTGKLSEKELYFGHILLNKKNQCFINKWKEYYKKIKIVLLSIFIFLVF